VPAIIFSCEADPDVCRRRLDGRSGDASDADREVFDKALVEWEGYGPRSAPVVRRIRTDDSPGLVLLEALKILTEARLYEAPPAGAARAAPVPA
jgi:predicted kinase